MRLDFETLILVILAKRCIKFSEHDYTTKNQQNEMDPFDSDKRTI